MDDEIEIIDSEGDQDSNESLFGDDPAALGIDSDNTDIDVSEYDAEAAEEADEIEGQFQVSSFGFTWVFDDATGDFLKQGEQMVKVEGLDCFAEWITMLLATERRLYEVFEEDFGIDVDKVFNSGLGKDALRGLLEQEIRTAISIHNRFSDMTDFEMTIEDDIAHVSFVVNTTAGDVAILSDVVGSAI